MKHVKEFLNQRKILVLILVVLAISMASNLYLYFGVDKPLQEKPGAWLGVPSTPVMIYRPLQGGMGRMEVLIWKRFMVGQEEKFNVTVKVTLWEPYVAARTYSLSFRIFNRTLDGEYPETSLVEKTVVVHKDKDAMYISAASGHLTVPVPPSYTPKIYIYKVEFTLGRDSYYIEFPITTGASGPVLLPPLGTRG